MKIWSDIMEFIENLINSSMFYYILVIVTYILVILFVVLLILSGKKKRRSNAKAHNNVKDIDAIDLEAVLGKMQETVSEPKEEIKTFEEEQEEKAIISYQELLQAVKKDVGEVTQTSLSEEVYADPLEELELPTLTSISNGEVEPLKPIVLASDVNANDVTDIEVESIPEKELGKTSSRFQNSEFISPIYGRVNNEIDYPKVRKSNNDIEDSSAIQTFKKDIDRVDNDDFLRALKQFRNNLE